jgi:hypothetical protein
LTSAKDTLIFLVEAPNDPLFNSSTAFSASSTSVYVMYPTPFDSPDSYRREINNMGFGMSTLCLIDRSKQYPALTRSLTTKPFLTGPMKEKWVIKSVVVVS